MGHFLRNILKPVNNISGGVGDLFKGVGDGVSGLGKGAGKGLQSVGQGVGSFASVLSNPIILIGGGVVVLMILSKV